MKPGSMICGGDLLSSINIDDPETWFKNLDDHLQRSGLLINVAFEEIELPPYLEEYSIPVLERLNQPEVRLAIDDWLLASHIKCFHATRLTNSGIASIQKFGLRALEASERESRLLAITASSVPSRLKKHYCSKIRENIQKFKNRDNGRIYFGLSRQFLISEANHYLKYGSEFDQCVIVHTFEEDRKDLLSRDSIPCIVENTFSGFDIVNKSVELNGSAQFLTEEFLQRRAAIRVSDPTTVTEWNLDFSISFRSMLPTVHASFLDMLKSH